MSGLELTVAQQLQRHPSVKLICGHTAHGLAAHELEFPSNIDVRLAGIQTPTAAP